MRPLHAFGLLSGALAGLGMHASVGLPTIRACGALLIGFLRVCWQVRVYEPLRLPADFDERLVCNVTIVDPPLRRGDELYFSARLESDALTGASASPRALPPWLMSAMRRR